MAIFHLNTSPGLKLPRPDRYAWKKKCPTAWWGISCQGRDTIEVFRSFPESARSKGSEFDKGFPDSFSCIATQFKDIPSLFQFPDRHLQAIFSVKYLLTARQYLTASSIIYR